MRPGSRSTTKRKPGFKRTNRKTSALKATTIRINPGTARKPRRRSSLSSQVIATHGKGPQFARKVDRVVLNAIAINAALPPDICAFGESSAIVFGEADPPLHAIARCLLWRVSETVAPKKTPLSEEHVRLGAKMVPFAGWLMPVQYTSIVEEHQAVRNNVGIFDISHMGQLIVDGAGAREWLNTMLTNNVGKLDVGMGQYSFLLNERGGIIDDLIIYRIDEQKFLLVVNASRTDEDFAWLQKHLEGRSPDRPSGGLETAALCKLENRSADFGGVAIQGPRLIELFHALFGKDVEIPPRNHIIELLFNGADEISETDVSVARTGYTGEDGIEVFF